MINKERLKLGLKALRSGKYKQTRGALARLNPDAPTGREYCCLGILTETAIENNCDITVKNMDGSDVIFYGHQDQFLSLPFKAQDWYGFDSHDPKIKYNGREVRASYLNDSLRLSFDQIADLFEETYIKE